MGRKSNLTSEWSKSGLTRDKVHKRRATGGKQKPWYKNRKYALARPPALTKIGAKRVHTVRVRGGATKFRALRIDGGNFSWGSESKFIFDFFVTNNHKIEKTTAINYFNFSNIFFQPAPERLVFWIASTMHQTTNTSEPILWLKMLLFKLMLLHSDNGMSNTMVLALSKRRRWVPLLYSRIFSWIILYPIFD